MNRRRTILLACAALAATTLSAAFLQGAAGPNAALAVAATYGAGAFVMAWITSRATEYPRWAWFGSAGVFALALVVAALAWPAPSQVKDWSTMAWMFPWLHLTTALSSPPAKGACSPGGAWSGPLILGTSIVFSSILLVAAWLTR